MLLKDDSDSRRTLRDYGYVSIGKEVSRESVSELWR